MDESPLPSRRRVLLRGGSVAYLTGKLRSYEALDASGPDTFAVGLRGDADGPWFQLDLAPELPVYHFHNLGMWMAGLPGEPDVPDQIILQSRGPLAVDYWLVPRDQGSVLHGRRADNSPYAYDLATAASRIEPALQASPMTERLALMNRGVPTALGEDWDLLPLAAEDSVTPFLFDGGATTFVGRMVRALFGAR